MKSLTLKFASLALAMALAALPLQSALAVSANETAVQNGLNYLATQQGADGQVSGYSAGITSWAAMAYVSAGFYPADVFQPGGQSLMSFVQSNPPAAGASLAYERDILAIVASAANPYDFGGTNYVAALQATHNGGQIGSATGVNDDVFGILALLSSRVSTTDSGLTDAVAFVLAHQHANGGFSYTTDPATGSDVDTTAAAIMALKAASDAGLTVPGSALTNAKAYILSTKNADGGFPYDPLTPADWGGPVSNVSSTSWVIMAFESLGLGATADSTDAQAYVRSTQQADGSFPYNLPATYGGDTFDTAYAVIALAGDTLPLSIYEGALPAATQSPSPSPSVTSSPTPSATPSTTPSATPSVTPVATPGVTPSVTPGSVLGAATTGILPAVGSRSGIMVLFLLIVLGLTSFLAVRFRRTM